MSKMLRAIKEEIKDFAMYQWSKYNTQIKFTYVLSAYLIGVVWAHQKIGVSYFALGAIAAVTLLLYPLCQHIKRGIGRWTDKKTNITWAGRDEQNINAMSDVMQDKVRRHKICALLYLELMTLQGQVNKVPMTNEEKAKLGIEIYRLRLDIIEYFAREKNKYSGMDVQDLDTPSLF